MGIYKTDAGQWIISLCYKRQKAFARLPAGSSKADAKAAEIELAAKHKAKVDADAAYKKKHAFTPGNPTLERLLNWYAEKHIPTLRSQESARYAVARLDKYVRLNDPGVGEWFPKASHAPAIAQRFIQDNPQLKPASINRTLGVLKKALSHFFKIGVLDVDISRRITRLPENNTRDSYTDEATATLIAAHASPKVRAAIFIAAYTGMRRGEILKLRPEDISEESITVQAGNTKTLRTRIIPISDKVRPYLSQIPIGLTVEGLATGYDRARKKAGFPEARFHDLRHGAATALVKAGVDLFVVQKILGHSSSNMTQRYAKMQLDTMRDAVNKI